MNLGDITKINENELEDFNMICGGSPCQDFSISGKQKGSIWTCGDCGEEYNPLTVHWSKRTQCPKCNSENIEKTRSSLLVEYLRVVKTKKPNFGIYENVKNIVGKQFKETFRMFTNELEEYGYNVYWKVLNSKNYGIPQNRERVYLIFIKKDLDNEKFEFPQPFDNGLRLKDLLEDKVDEKYYISSERVDAFIKSNMDKLQVEKRIAENTLKIEQVGNIRGTGSWKNQQTGRIYSTVGISPTLNCVSGGGHEPKIVEDTNNTKCLNSKGGRGGIEGLQPSLQDRVYDSNNISVAITGSYQPSYTSCNNANFRIRKLTPKECFRLMGFSDDAFNAAQNVGVSNSQLYKQAGNSIVVDVLYYIYKELYTAMPYLFKNLKLSSFFSGIGAFEVALNRLYEDINSGNFTKPQVN